MRVTTLRSPPGFPHQDERRVEWGDWGFWAALITATVIVLYLMLTPSPDAAEQARLAKHKRPPPCPTGEAYPRICPALRPALLP